MVKNSSGVIPAATGVLFSYSVVLPGIVLPGFALWWLVWYDVAVDEACGMTALPSSCCPLEASRQAEVVTHLCPLCPLLLGMVQPGVFGVPPLR